jgi:hypothetical protein
MIRVSRSGLSLSRIDREHNDNSAADTQGGMELDHRRLLASSGPQLRKDDKGSGMTVEAKQCTARRGRRVVMLCFFPNPAISAGFGATQCGAAPTRAVDKTAQTDFAKNYKTRPHHGHQIATD